MSHPLIRSSSHTQTGLINIRGLFDRMPVSRHHRTATFPMIYNDETSLSRAAEEKFNVVIDEFMTQNKYDVGRVF